MIVPTDFLGPDAADWLPDQGRPPRGMPHAGMPAYATANGAGVVMESLVAFDTLEEGRVVRHYLPASYGRMAARHPTGLADVHDQPGAVRDYRPLIYREEIRSAGGEYYRDVAAIGSQMELEWRYGLIYGLVDQALGLPDRREEANRKAEELLRSELTPQQRLELLTTGMFSVWGHPELLNDITRRGDFDVGILYTIEPGNGYQWRDPWTREVWMSCCYHTEDWIPHADVALATKLLIESGPEGELEANTAATRRKPARKPGTRMSRGQVEAFAMERALVAA